MKKILLSLFLISVIATSVSFGQEVTLLKRTIYITPQKFLRYWKNPKAAEPVYDTYSWVPKIQFEVLGPIPSGSKIFVTFEKPNSKEWITFNMQTPTLESDIREIIKPENIDENELEKQAITETGIFSFKVKIKNSFEGKESTLFTGKFRVELASLDQSIADNKGKKEFMINYDWMLPISYVWLNIATEEKSPPLSTLVCFKGKIQSNSLEAHLFYNGKEVAKTELYTEGTVLTTGADEPHHRYTCIEFSFLYVRGFNQDNAVNGDNIFFLDKNSGDYEIKIVRNNKLARVISFKVSPDGTIADNGIASSAKLGGIRKIISATILNKDDGDYNANAWKTEALFFNPLQGFEAK